MKFLVAGAAAALCLALGQSAFAAEENPGLTSTAALTCRIATGYETPAERALGFNTLLVCKPTELMSNRKPNEAAFSEQRPSNQNVDLSRALSPMQMNDAWNAYIDQTFSIDHSP